MKVISWLGLVKLTNKVKPWKTIHLLLPIYYYMMYFKNLGIHFCGDLCSHMKHINAELSGNDLHCTIT